ncbi:MAG TPA: MFS transporter [Kineosporiaceae bacterium]|nr:MFS transporter [Kineosporiaceae bacterium]
MTVLGSGLVMLDGTAVNVALARIGTDLGAGFAGLQWTVNAYTLTLAALILLGGSLGDRFGRRKVFLIGVIWFALASLLCGLAPNISALVVARGLQGIGGALLTPGSLAIISASFAGHDRAAAVGAWSGLGGLAGAVGPFLGGWLVGWSWRAVFLINLPVAVAVVALAARHVPESRDPDATGRLDWAGALLGAVGLAGITYTLTEVGRSQPVPLLLGWGVAGVTALGCFAVLERRVAHPLVPGALLRIPQFVAANLVTVLVYGAIGSLFVLLVMQLQSVSGFSPLVAGVSLLPITVIMILFSAQVGRLADRIGPRIPMTLGPAISAVGVLLMLRIGAGASYLADVLPAATVFGAGLALTVAPLTATVLDAAGPQHAGAASGVNNAVARAAGLLAVAAIPAVAGISDYTDAAAFDRGFRIAMLIVAAMLALGAVVAAVLIRSVSPGERPVEPVAPAQPERLSIETWVHCGVPGPPLHPRGSDSAVPGGRRS